MPAARIVPALFGLCCLWGLRLTSPATAETTPAPVAPIHLDYVLYSHSFHVMNLDVAMTLAPSGYAISLHDRTTGMIGMLLHSDTTSVASGRFDGDRAIPIDFASSGVSRGANRATRIAYADGEPRVETLTPVDPDREPVPAAATDHSIDSLSAIVELVRTVQATAGCDGSTRIFDGARLSRLTAHTVGRQPMPPNDESTYAGTALRCDFVGLQLGGFLHNADEARMRQPQTGTAWLQRVLPDAPLLPVRVTFEHPHLGVLTVLLVSAHR